MAPYSSYDAYDPRPRPPRHDDSYRRNGVYMTPAAGHASTTSTRVGEDTRFQNDRHLNRRSHDSRYDFPPPPPPDTGRPSRPQRLPTQRHSWPPQPTCEDEAVSLAKEAGSRTLLKAIGKDEAQSRGTIDQDPIIQDVPELINRSERRFVVVTDSKKEAKSTGIPTPPTSEDERARKARRRPSKLNTDLDDGVPELSKRTASPYAFSKTIPLPRAASSSDRFLPPDTLTPPPTDPSRRQERFSATSMPSTPRRDSVRVTSSAKRSGDYFSAGYSSSDNAIADDDGNMNDPTARSNRYKPNTTITTPGVPTTDVTTSVVDFAAPSANAPSIRKQHLDARRNTDTGNTVSSMPKLRVDKARKASPLMSATAFGDLDDSAIYSTPSTPGTAELYPPRSREPSYVSSRGVSPASAVSARSTAPHVEPFSSTSKRLSSEWSINAPSGHSPTSRPGSASGSRSSSPSPRTPGDSPRLPRTDTDWNTLLAANHARQTKPSHPSRLAASMRQESLPDVLNVQFGKSSSARPTGGLPYPLDDGPGTPTTFMPSERDHQYFGPLKSNLGVSFMSEAKTLSRAASPALSTAQRTSGSARPARPPIQTRHSVANVSPTEERPRPKSFHTSSEAKKELAALLKKGLPECQRPDPVAGYDDWYTVIGAPSLAFCPGCIDSVFERTVFRPSIRRLPQLNFNTKVQCALGSSAWIRLAWLLTLQQQRTDLTLLKDLADMEETSEPCPGSHEAVRSWYGLRDNEGLFVRDFHICYSDVRKIERLLPTLSGLFIRLPHRASYEKRICAVRADGNRFSTYLDALISTHEKALASRKGADSMPFIDLVERKTRLHDCTRDNMLIGGLWHFIPNVSAFTVCEDCYEAVVEPEVRKNSDVAMRFNRTVQPVYGEGMGSSCQLYSRRMRQVFRRAVQDSDLKYLARKANERREAELRLQERYKDVMRRARRVAREGDGSEDDERRLNRELERITEEWQAKWE